MWKVTKYLDLNKGTNLGYPVLVVSNITSVLPMENFFTEVPRFEQTILLRYFPENRTHYFYLKHLIIPSSHSLQQVDLARKLKNSDFFSRDSVEFHVVYQAGAQNAEDIPS